MLIQKMIGPGMVRVTLSRPYGTYLHLRRLTRRWNAGYWWPSLRNRQIAVSNYRRLAKGNLFC